MHRPDAVKALHTWAFGYEEQLELVDRALEGRTQIELCELLGIAERTLRCYKAPAGGQFTAMPYTVRYCLEAIVDADARRDRSKSRKHGRGGRAAVRR